jgi:ABC-2 type transport system permease protein
MRAAVALARAHWLSAASYRVGTLLSFASLLAVLVPVYFIAGAIQPVLADDIATQGGEYFAFLVVGMIAFSFLTTSVTTLPATVRSSLSTGTLEALLATPSPPHELLAGLLGSPFAWTIARAGVLAAGAALMGADFAWMRLPMALLVLALLVVAHLPFGIGAAALVLAFRTAGPFPQGVIVLSALLGGVYYPTQVIPSWIQGVSAFLPLTYGLRALRMTLLEGAPARLVLGDVLVLACFAAVLLGLSALAFSLALRHARRSASLAQY